MKMTIFLFSKFLHLLFFVLVLKFPQKPAKSCVVLLLKGQLFVLENHGICKNRLKYQNINYERAYLKSRLTIL